MIMLADPLLRETRVAVQREGAKGAFTLRGRFALCDCDPRRASEGCCFSFAFSKSGKDVMSWHATNDDDPSAPSSFCR